MAALLGDSTHYQLKTYPALRTSTETKKSQRSLWGDHQFAAHNGTYRRPITASETVHNAGYALPISDAWLRWREQIAGSRVGGSVDSGVGERALCATGRPARLRAPRSGMSRRAAAALFTAGAGSGRWR